jgi:molecular chaperone DnaK (HSP70)
MVLSHFKVIEVVATDGDPHLGGSDFYTGMIKYSLCEFAREHGEKDINNNQKRSGT